jgi:hypothetical protein
LKYEKDVDRGISKGFDGLRPLEDFRLHTALVRPHAFELRDRKRGEVRRRWKKGKRRERKEKISEDITS